jgi:PAS domain S-box-containing protein
MKIMDFYPANCKNCYKCVRNCPVKAIRIVNDQAEIIEDKCIGCGRCFNVCPQNARNIHSDLDNVKDALKDRNVVVSIAPSYRGIYPNYKKLIGSLKKLGVNIVEETAVGAELVTNLYGKYIEKNPGKSVITSCCPSVNLLIRRYFSEISDSIIPVDTPMIIHSKLLKEKYGKTSYVVFLGPCISKKIEAYGYQKQGVIDAVISFEELEGWLKDEDIVIDDCDEITPVMEAGRTGAKYPLERGILSGLEKSIEKNNMTSMAVNGFEDCMMIFEALRDGQIENICIEANVCSGGCIGGPAVPKSFDNVFKRKIRAMDSIDEMDNDNIEDRYFDNIDRLRPHDRIFTRKKYSPPVIGEDQMKKILARMGKYSKDDELNCGACGYDSCRDKAVAVYEGNSHPEMCIPYMRMQAERLSNIIFEYSPNILILLDEDKNVLDINPQGEKVFNVKLNNIKGKSVDMIMSSNDFDEVLDQGINIIDKKINFPNYGLKLKENIIHIKEHKLIYGLFSNVTDEENRNKELAQLKFNTLDTVNTVIDRQMRVAQEIAGLLGETTAEAKIALLNLKKVVENEEGELK